MLKQKQTAYFILLLLPTSIALWWYGYLGSYSRMLADDFCSFYFAERLGLFRSIWYWRLTWSGRYSAFAADWLALKVFGADQMQFVVPLALLAWLFFLTAAIHLGLHSGISNTRKLAISVLLGSISLFVLLVLSPNIPQSLFWFNGMRSYALPLIVLTLYAVLFQLRMKILSRFGTWMAALLAFLLLFLSGGLSETFAVVQVALMACLIARKWIMENPKKPDADLYLLIAGLLGALASLLAVITAPGNTIRQSFLPSPPGLVDLILISLQGYTGFLYNILASPEQITAFLGAILTTIWVGISYTDPLPQRSKQIILYLIGGLVLSFVCFPPAVFAYNEPPPSRIMIIPLYMLIAGFLSAGFWAGNLLAMKRPLTGKREFLLVLPAILCIGFSAWTTVQALDQNKQFYAEFAEKWDKTDAQIRETRDTGGDSVHIADMTNWANLEQPNMNPEFWATECYSAYYGIQVYGPP